MKYNVGDKVKCVLAEFDKVYGDRNVWVIDSILTQVKPYPSLYLCYREDDKHKTLFQFPENEVEKL